MAGNKPGPKKGDPKNIERGMINGRENARFLKARDPDYFKKLGAKGGAATKKRHGTRHYSEIGKLGGAQRIARLRGEDYYEEKKRLDAEKEARK